MNWGHASAKPLKRVLADSDGGDMHLLNYVDGALEQREVCRAFDKGPHVPIFMRGSTVSMFN